MNILIALDGSTNSEAFTGTLANFPMTAETRIGLVVVHDQTLLSAHRINDLTSKLIIEKAQAVIGNQYPDVSICSEIRSGPAAAQLLQACTSFEADVILAGAHSPRPFHKELLGSIAAQIAKHADCSVRLVRPSSNGMRVLACFDNTELDESVLQEIMRLNWPPQSALRLMHVMEQPTEVFSYNPHEDARLFVDKQEHYKSEVTGFLNQFADQIHSKFPDLDIDTFVSVEVETVQEILDAAQKWSAGTLLIGSHRRIGLERFWLGSVSEPVAAKSICSVHIVRHNDDKNA
ncbi:MAG: universal stress protein [Cyanobacteria bacterium REEB67]|nr:universal stress protein [Cyanobacteria bacterium REEB67]